MTTAKLLVTLGLVIMAAALTYGFTLGEFWVEGDILFDLVWGQVAIIDVYVGFGLFIGWVVYREGKRWWVSAPIALGVLCLGNFTACAYAFWALFQSRGDWQKFWMNVEDASRGAAENAE